MAKLVSQLSNDYFLWLGDWVIVGVLLIEARARAKSLVLSSYESQSTVLLCNYRDGQGPPIISVLGYGGHCHLLLLLIQI